MRATSLSISLAAVLAIGCSGSPDSNRQAVGEQNGGQCTPSSTDMAGAGCTLTQGYWKTHPSAWPVQSLTIGGVSYTEDELLVIFDTAPMGDASLVLAHQLIAAMLNVASGAVAPSASAQAISDAQAWMTANLPAGGKLPYGVSSSSSAGTDAIALGNALDQFNMGAAGIPHCSDGPGSGGTMSGSGDCNADGGASGDGGAGGTKPPPIGSDPTGTGTGTGGVGVL